MYQKESLLDKLNRKMGRYAIRNLMLVIVVITGLVWLLDFIVTAKTDYSIISYLYFDKQLILQGQVWRVVSFVFVPSAGSLFMLAISLYFDWLVGNALEGEWGAFRFNIYYLVGVLGAIGSGFITGYATNYYLHLSLFLAFAILNPDFQVLVFFFLPIKMKWLAIIDAVGLVLLFIIEGWVGRIALLVALVNIPLFFWRDLVWKIKNIHRRKKYRREAKRKNDKDYPFDL